MQPSPKCPYGTPVKLALAHERLELAQITTEMFGWHGCVLPAGLPRRIGGPGSQARAVLPNLPECGRLARVLDDPTLIRVRGGECRGSPGGDLGLVGSAEFDQQPALTDRKLRHRGGTLADPNDVDDACVEAFDRHRAKRQDRRDRVSGGGHVGIAQHQQHADRRSANESHGRLAEQPHVPSVPTQAFATSKPCSGSRCSSE